jgi:hypothetical protein
MSEIEEIKNFTVAFFTNLKANLFWDNDTKLTITTVPENFEKFYGKKAPYELVFNQLDAKNGEEIMASGSFLLNSMKEYLQNKGQATLLKIDPAVDAKSEIEKRFRLKNSSINSISKKEAYDWLARFTFLTTIQYLNEKEQFMNPLYVKDNLIIDFNLENYKTLEGKKEELNIDDLKFYYSLAKERLKTILEPKISKISSVMDIKLEKEIQRVKQHYLNQIAEDKQNLEKSVRQIKELEYNLSKNHSVEEAESFKIRIKKLKESIDALKNEKRKEDLKREEDFFIKDETNKHSLAIDNKLMNTTIIYYPIYTYSINLKNPEISRAIEITFNPLNNEISKVSCDCCTKEIKELSLCSFGHVTCHSCLRGCSVCSKEYCKKCLEKECFACGKKICRKCGKSCRRCNKFKCLSHFNKAGICSSCEGR